MTDTFAELLMKPIARAVYPCGCEVHYNAGTYGVHHCREHEKDMHRRFPKVYKFQYIENGARNGEFVIWKPVPIAPARRATDTTLERFRAIGDKP